MPSCVALIPARAGSKRIQGKNIRMLGGLPLIAHTIRAAVSSGVFAAVVSSTESNEIADIAVHHGAEVPFLRRMDLAADLSPDIEWVEDALAQLADRGRRFDCFSILRPTSPFRSSATIRRAWDRFIESKADSIRAVEPCRQHPGKMWVVEGGRMRPFAPVNPGEIPSHSQPYQALPRVYVQNASLEIAWCRVVTDGRSISGTDIAPFMTQGYEGFDINTPEDWILAEHYVASGAVKLPGNESKDSPEAG